MTGYDEWIVPLPPIFQIIFFNLRYGYGEARCKLTNKQTNKQTKQTKETKGEEQKEFLGKDVKNNISRMAESPLRHGILFLAWLHWIDDDDDFSKHVLVHTTYRRKQNCSQIINLFVWRKSRPVFRPETSHWMS